MSITEDIKKSGIKVTNARTQVLNFLRKNQTGHFSAESIHQHLTKQGNDFGIATIYRTLTQLESADLLLRHSFVDGLAVYEANFNKHHDHAVCIACNKVFEFHDELIEQQQHLVAKQLGIEAIRHTHVIYGYCDPQCKEEQSI